MFKENVEKKEKSYVMQYHKNEADTLKEWTFKPHITDYNNISLGNSKANFYERSRAWFNEREKKISKERDIKNEDETKFCSFTPQVNILSKVMIEGGLHHNNVLKESNIYDEISIK